MQTHEVPVEIWRPIPKFPYQVSNWGRIKNVETGHILKPQPITSRYSDRKYYHVGLMNGEGRIPGRRGKISRSVHRIVAEVFLGPSSQQIDHIDADKSNNAVENLRYVTGSENVRHSLALGLSKPPPIQAKVTPENVAEMMTQRHSGWSIRAIANYWDLSYGHTASLLAGRRVRLP